MISAVVMLGCWMGGGSGLSSSELSAMGLCGSLRSDEGSSSQLS